MMMLKPMAFKMTGLRGSKAKVISEGGDCVCIVQAYGLHFVSLVITMTSFHSVYSSNYRQTDLYQDECKLTLHVSFSKKWGPKAPCYSTRFVISYGDTAVTATVATLLLSTRPSLTTKVSTYTPATSVRKVGAEVVDKDSNAAVLEVGTEVSVHL